MRRAFSWFLAAILVWLLFAPVALAVDPEQNAIPICTVYSLNRGCFRGKTTPDINSRAYVRDGQDGATPGTTCGGLGTTLNLCKFIGTKWIVESVGGSGTGDVSGPATPPADGDVALFDTTTGKLLKSGGALASSTTFISRDGTQPPTADIPFGDFKAEMNPTCANYAFTAGTTGSLGTMSLYGHLLKVYLSSGAGNVITVSGCTSFTGTASGTVNTCSCDLAGGGDTCVPLDGTSGSAGFIVPSPQNITITLVSSATNGSVDVCQF